ncbi:amidophosphoribosyltransferase [Notoacmeibacter marinus]|uniref:Amidophosphoribosyltransferase n=1 Tax=Notoacmeibacter marinus TaxID=1876515 RepID=A0A231V3X9_9HYPH|nr:ComF family protein [Notoacmeibacter marinus]OXT02721.1 amidophosphoribosyltransferase [Notoacmeibacter marinus]
MTEPSDMWVPQGGDHNDAAPTSERSAKAKAGGSASIRRLAVSWGGSAARIFFPPSCLECGRIVSAPGTYCPECWPRLRAIEAPVCPVLGTPFSVEMGPGILSAEALANPPVFERARAAVVHDGPARGLVSALKYHDRTDLARWMAGWMIRAGGELLDDADLIVPVPLHRRRLLARRFNQSAELARAIAAQTDIALRPECLVRKRATPRQVGLTRGQRQVNVRGAFEVPEAAIPLLSGRRVLLVDDVYTTGATVTAASRALLKGGAGAIDVMTFSRVLAEGRLA